MTRHRHDVDLRPVWAILTATASVTCAITWAAWWVGINRITRPRPTATPVIQKRGNVSYIQRTQPLLRGESRRQAEREKRKP